MTRKIHYGWIICLGCTLLMLCCSGMVMNSFSAYLPFLVEEFDLAQTQAAMISTIRSFTSFVFKFIVLWFINRLGARWTMLIGSLFTVASIVCYSRATSVLDVYVAAALTGAGYGMATMVPISIVLNKWFEQKLAIAVAVCASSTGFSAMILPALITKLVEAVGLSKTFFLQSILMLILCGLAILLIRNTPGEKNMEPYGHNMSNKAKKTRKSVLTGIELTGVHKILFLLAPLFLGAVTVTVPSLFTLHFGSLGFDKMTAAFGVSAYGFTLLIGKFAYGFSDELIGNVKTNYLFLFILGLGTLTGCFIGQSVALMAVSAGLIGMGCALMTVGVTMWAKDFSAPEQYAETIRLYQVLTMVGTMIMSPVAGMIADTTGNYIPVFAIFTAMSAGMAILIFSAYSVGAKKMNAQK